MEQVQVMVSEGKYGDPFEVQIDGDDRVRGRQLYMISLTIEPLSR